MKQADEERVRQIVDASVMKVLNVTIDRVNTMYHSVDDQFVRLGVVEARAKELTRLTDGMSTWHCLVKRLGALEHRVDSLAPEVQEERCPDCYGSKGIVNHCRNPFHAKPQPGPLKVGDAVRCHDEARFFYGVVYEQVELRNSIIWDDGTRSHEQGTNPRTLTRALGYDRNGTPVFEGDTISVQDGMRLRRYTIYANSPMPEWANVLLIERKEADNAANE